jgi:hypothetical protein
MKSSDVPNQSRAQAYQVFISSTFLDLAAERKAVREALSDLNMPLAAVGVCLIPVDLQGGADNQPPLDVCLRHIEKCDIVVTLIGHRAGGLTQDKLSITECEFDHAQSRGIPCLAYVRDDAVPVLPEHIDRETKLVKVLRRFRRKIDASVKRDSFRSPEHLRGHVQRDVLWWLLNQTCVKDRLGQLSTPSSLPQFKTYLDAVHGGDFSTAVNIVTSRRFVLDMRRFGKESVHRNLLLDLLELGSLSGPTRVIDPSLRSRLLLELLSEFQESNFSAAALHEARTLEEQILSPEYSFHVARAEAQFHTSCSKAQPALIRMIRYARVTGDLHRVAEGRRAVANYYSSRGDHQRAKRWYWRSIQKLCKMPEVCPHCLGKAFLGMAGEELNCHECATIDNRLLKAYLAAKIIPDRAMQAKALIMLSQHLGSHNQLDDSVACAVLAARLAKQTRPEDDESGLSAILAELILQHGREAISEVLHRIETEADVVLNRLIELHQVGGFVKGLGLKPSPAGDHW